VRPQQKIDVLDVLRIMAEWGTVALCLWIGVFQTPIGALLRGGGSRGLLSYYSGGVSARIPSVPADGSALAAGTYVAYKNAEASVQARARSSAMSLGANVQRLDDPATGPRELDKALSRLRHDGASDAGAVLTLFAGPDPARFAEERARVEGRGLGSEDLGRQLPPGYEAALAATGSALAFSVARSLAWPAKKEARITSPFGWRIHPVSGERKLHKGVDLSLVIGSPVFATAPGIVTRSSYDASNGNIVVVAHDHNVRTLYLHNSERLVSVGDRIEQGTVLARSGDTGIATGPHLHYQLELFSQPTDPEPFRR
jgi:murein DD-endopeptidase MepM/ murein hydrolase activator NlpD